MKSNLVAGFLAAVVLGLAIALLVRHNRAVVEHKADQDYIHQLANDLNQTSSRFDDEKNVNTRLNRDLDVRNLQITNLNTTLAETRTTLTDTQARLTKTEADAKAAAEAAAAEVAKRDARITELEGQNDEMTKKMVTLNTAIGSLEGQIKETERKLASSEGEREFLLTELKRLQAEKAELERQFNDLAVLREQVHKLKEELSIARRLEWIRQGLYGNQGQKGAERLMSGTRPAAARTNYNVDVEIKQDGTIKIAPTPTNAPPAK